MWFLGFVLLLLKTAIVLTILLGLAAYLILVERKLLGRFQIRFGPNRAGPFGIWQPIADGIKMILKEDTIPQGADRVVFKYAPAVVATVAILIAAVIPFSRDAILWGYDIPMVISDLNVGLLYVLALSSLSVYGVALGGWASNSKYSLLGGIRGAAQMVSYELPLGLSLVPVVMLAGSFSLVDIVNAQACYPFVVVQPIAFVIFLIAAVAESKRLPFDLPEAENELNAGYHTEFSGMRFALYFIGEYVHMMVLGALVAVFFLGGWRGPWLPPVVWLVLKALMVPFFLIWTRATLPRLRYDQLMHFGWKLLIPIALLNILATGAVMLWLRG
ncbi:NADH-quinone oxidoreductase subunit NuoH [Desulfoferrobacter suflitae]|uniref:NADH-quinone oxidoreductase subunit NuoH n=1 Tax=Desulfoferrobacter suflitae TaxID=2865782 RepID=UPI002164AD4D|nr:NADH-quinone oxidoreductase subunit NuoH [Desulfoferrobacter suflitae]MCK8600330.1 NADH-quinone oxidoreductase subunit NuoH [Desulfoferrobacter suflitae]